MDMVWVPVTADELDAVRRGAGADEWRGFAVTQRFLDSFGYEEADEEEVAYALCVIAGVDSLVRHGRRLVLAVADDTFEPDAGPDADFGAVRIGAIAWPRVRSIFADEPDAAADIEKVSMTLTASTPAEETPLGDAWAADAVQSLLVDRDLLWFDPSEAAIRFPRYAGEG